MTLEHLLSKLNYPEEAARAVLDAVHADISKLAESAYQEEGMDFPLCGCSPLLRLCVVTYLLLQKFHDYQQRGVPEQIIFDTFQDVPLRSDVYRQRTGELGLSREDVVWFRHIMEVNIFRIGSLQYQPFQMLYLDKAGIGEDYMIFSDSGKRVLPPGSPVLNCHVPRGTDLSPEAVGASLTAARAFFERHVPDVDFRGFLCYSWLLYPPMVRCLSDASHIRQFAERFSIIGSCGDPDQAMENLTPGEGSLYKLFREKPEAFGFSCGIIAV